MLLADVSRRIRLPIGAALVLGLAAHCTPSRPAPVEAGAAPAPAVPVTTLADASATDAITNDAPADVPAADSGPPAPRAVDAHALEQLVADSERRKSDGLVVIQHGKLLGEWTFGKPRGPIQTMSITKSVLSLAVGTLVDSGKLSLDQSVSTLFPEWANDERKAITIAHLLTHSSGLEEGNSTLPIYQSRDFVRFTLKAPLVHAPGTHYEYGNRAANLLAGVVAKAAGMPTERYVQKVLFEPMEIRQEWWAKDRAGNAQGMAGLHLTPRDLAKLGELVLAEGRWNEKQLVSAEWIRASTAELAPVQPDSRRLGRLFWLIPEWTERVVDDSIVEGWRAAGVDGAFIEKATPLVGKKFRRLGPLLEQIGELFHDPTLKDWNETTWKRGLADVRTTFGPVVGCYSAGTLGQYLVVLPRDRLVAVRMRRMPKNAKGRDDVEASFLDFVERVQGLVGD
jgi:CubicO group peptidase (beta-lactamase class C family)